MGHSTVDTIKLMSYLYDVNIRCVENDRMDFMMACYREPGGSIFAFGLINARTEVL